MEVLGPALLLLMISQTIIQLTALGQHCLLGMLATTLFFFLEIQMFMLFTFKFIKGTSLLVSWIPTCQQRWSKHQEWQKNAAWETCQSDTCAEKRGEVGTLEMKVACMGISSVSRNWKVTKCGPLCIWNISNMEIQNTMETLNKFPVPTSHAITLQYLA